MDDDFDRHWSRELSELTALATLLEREGEPRRAARVLAARDEIRRLRDRISLTEGVSVRAALWRLAGRIGRWIDRVLPARDETEDDIDRRQW